MTITIENLIALLPLLITSATVVLVMLSVAIKRHHWWNATLTVAGLNAALVSVGYLYFFFLPQVGPQVVTPLLIVDGHACFYMALVLIGTLACATLSHAYLETYPGNKEELYLLLGLSAMGALVLVMSHHMASLFIGLELLSVPVYGMVAYTFRQQRSLEGGIKYMVLSAAASAFMLFGMALLYAEAGNLFFEGMGAAYRAIGLGSPFVMAGLAMILVGLCFKLSLVPFHLWTPDVYEGAPAPVGAFLATVSKIAVFAVFLRFVMVTPAVHYPVVLNLLAVLAFASIIIGNLLALMQTNVKRLLGYSSIAHFGYLMVAVLIGPQSIVAVGVYLATYLVTTLGAFGVISLMSSPYKGRDADTLADLRGLFWRRPYLTAVLTVAMLSLAGIPMTAGFIGKFFVILNGVQLALGQQYWWLLAAVVVGSAIGLYYYLRVMVTLYMTAPGMQRFDAPRDWGQRAGGIMVLLLAGLILLLGLYPTPLLEVLHHALIVPLR